MKINWKLYRKSNSWKIHCKKDKNLRIISMDKNNIVNLLTNKE